jgi:L-fucose isomerase-like protein
MSERNVKVGFVTLSRTTFSLEFARDVCARSEAMLKGMGVELVTYPNLVVEVEDARAAAKKFREAEIDLLIIQNGTFAAADLTVELATLTTVPLLLWAIPEPDVQGKRLLANSFCGANLNSSSLVKLNKQFKYFYACPEDAAFQGEIAAYFRTMKAYVNLKTARIGWVGMRCPGYYCSATDEVRLRRVIGTSIHHIDLLEVHQEMERISATQAATHVAETTQGKRVEASPQKLEGYGRLSRALMTLKERYAIDAFAVKCWPEFPTMFAQAPCAAVSWLNDMGVPTSCEGDVEGAVTMLLHRYLTGAQSFFADLIKYDVQEDTCVFWHCGSAPASLARPGYPVSVHDDFKGVGVTIEFPLKPGQITLSRIATVEDNYRILLATGTAVETELLARGTPVRAKMARSVADLVDTIIYQGFPHHYVVGYGDVSREIKALAQLWDLKVV